VYSNENQKVIEHLKTDSREYSKKHSNQ
jgi:hypothetical protein